MKSQFKQIPPDKLNQFNGKTIKSIEECNNDEPVILIEFTDNTILKIDCFSSHGMGATNYEKAIQLSLEGYLAESESLARERGKQTQWRAVYEQARATKSVLESIEIANNAIIQF